jgi:TatD DNase family protein
MIDTHVHLDKIAAEHVEGVVERAMAAGVTSIVTVGMNPGSSTEGLALAQRLQAVYAAPGIHPWEAAGNSSEEAAAKIRELVGKSSVVAVGEIGLDYEDNLFTGESYRSDSVRVIQRDVFRRQLHIAQHMELPVIVHSRGGAHGDIVRSLEEALPSAGAVIQFLSGTPEDVKAYVELGCYLSIGGITSDPRQTELRQAVQAIPLDRLMLETDAPYVPPIWKVGAPSEPSDLPAICAYVAALIGVPVKTLAVATTTNAQRLYRLPASPSYVETG